MPFPVRTQGVSVVWSEGQCSVGSVDVVVVHEDGEDPLEVRSVQNQ